MSNKNQPTNRINLGIIPQGRPLPGGPIPYRHPGHPGIGLMGPPMGPQMRPGPFGPMQFPPGPGFGGPPPFMGPPPFFNQPTPGKKKGKSAGGFGGGGPFGRAPVKLPPLNLKTTRDRYSDDSDDSREIRSARKDIDVKKYLDQVLSKIFFAGNRRC